MSARTTSRLAWAGAGLTVLLFLIAGVLGAVTPSQTLPPDLRHDKWADLIYPLHAVAFSIVGALILSRRSGNRIGWVACTIGLLTAVQSFAERYADYSLFAKPGLPAGEWMAWLTWWVWYPPFVLLVAVIPLLFPNGRLLSPRWRFVVWLAAAGTALQLIVAMLGNSGTTGDILVRNPLGIEAPSNIVQAMVGITGPLPMLCLVLATVSLVLRYRRADQEQRQQLKWFTSAVVLMAIVFVSGVLIAFDLLHVPFYRAPVIATLLALSFLSVPIAIGIAVLKYRLYDLDLVISKTLVFGVLAIFITAVYVAIAVGIGSLVGNRSKPNLILAIVATAVVAVAFQPVRERLQRVANRLVYGKRATPYEVLSEFIERMSEAYARQDVLPRMARVLADGTGAAAAEVWLRVGAELRRGAAWPGDASVPVAHRLSGNLMPEMPGTDRAVPVRYQGELLGALSVKKRGGESLTPLEEKLLSDLAVQAGLVLKNASLNTELVARLEELRASRSRLVAAQDAERRRIERDLHDGLQQELVAMLAKVRISRNQATRDPSTVDATLEELNQEIRQALKDLRELARGIHPPVLSDQGLVKAIEARVAHLPIEVAVEADCDLESARYAEDVEGAAYFFVCEGLANVMKHASATETTVRLSPSNGSLRVEVIDDGKGFDPNRVSRSGLSGLEDRIEAVGGTVSVVSRPGDGTRLMAFLPARRTSPA